MPSATPVRKRRPPLANSLLQSAFSHMQGISMDTQALDLLANLGHLFQTAVKVTAAQVGIAVGGYFTGPYALHELQDGYFEAENGRVLAVVKSGAK